MHHVRCGWRDKRRANVAMDKVINDILEADKVGTPIKSGVFLPGARQYAWEQLYDDEEKNGGGGGGKGQGQGEYTPGEGNDDLGQDDGAGEELTPEEIEGIKREVLQARNAAKSVGKMPASMEGLIEKMIKPNTPWHQLTERFMLLQVKTGTSWRRPNKRFLSQDIYMPSYDIQPRMGTVVIQMDESGSIGDKELQHFSGHINSIIEVCRPEKVLVLHTSTHVAKVEEFTAEDYPINFKSFTTGGTDMTAGFDWVEENGEEPDVFICLTDGYTPFGTAPGYPVLWLITSDVVADHGETIHYEITGD
jgi:predicted metal-dependent peptidase